MKVLRILCLLLVLLLIGCSNSETDNRTTDANQNITKINNPTPIDQAMANKVKEEVLKRDDIKRVRGVNTDNELLIAIEVEQLKQFNEQKIEKKVKDSLKKKYPDNKIEVTSDQKIFIELDKLEKKVADNKVNHDNIYKEFKKIKNLINDPT